MQVKCLGNHPYGTAIHNFFMEYFPRITNPNSSSILEIVSSIIIGSKDLRYGSMPSPEIQVSIRAVIRDAISKNLPIPILVPWGGRKTEPIALIDIAEVAGIRQIINVDEEVKKYYTPGLQVNIAIEDVGAEWLYRGQPNLEENVLLYSESTKDLVNILKGSTNITPLTESRMMLKDKYFELSKKYSDLIFELISYREAFPEIDNEDIIHSREYNKLLTIGWKGTIPKEQRDYYIQRYKSLYNVSHNEAARMLADYFAGAKARYDLNAKGIPNSQVEGFIKVNFSHPVPNDTSTAVHWRTVPESQGRTHIAPWRGKGFLKIDKNNKVTSKVTSWTDSKLEELEKAEVIITDGNLSVRVQTDYIAE